MEKVAQRNLSTIVQNFSPAWFASVMGTGALALACNAYSGFLPFLKPLSFILFYFNIIWAFVLFIPWVLRWIFYPNRALSDLNHPITTQFYATLGIGFLVIGAGEISLLHNAKAGFVIWFAGALLTISFAILIPLILFEGRHVQIDHINPAWFIPPVGLIVIPIGGALLLPYFSGLTWELLLALNYFAWGAGFFLWLSLLALTFYRFILHHPLPSNLIPTFWINLGPIGAGTVSLLNLIKNTTFLTSKETFGIMGLILWGFGIWWVLIAGIVTILYIKRANLPFALSWWSFTFPLGAYVLASHSLANFFNLSLVDDFGYILFWLLVIFWCLTFFNSLRGIYTRKLFS
ncbi:MAG: tellurite-resistance/dicarboxylate transporter [bacterium]